MVGGHCAGPVVGGVDVPQSEFLCKALTASWWGHKHKAEGERTKQRPQQQWGTGGAVSSHQGGPGEASRRRC